jgi:hypothetical protein
MKTPAPNAMYTFTDEPTDTLIEVYRGSMEYGLMEDGFVGYECRAAVFEGEERMYMMEMRSAQEPTHNQAKEHFVKVWKQWRESREAAP